MDIQKLLDESTIEVEWNELTKSMDIPEKWRFIRSDSSREWCGRNLFFRNQNHPNFSQAALLLEQLGVKVFGNINERDE